MTSHEGLLLDTHVWLWVYGGSEDRMHPRAVAAIRAALEDGTAALCTASIWEAAQLVRVGRLQPRRPTREWLAAAIRGFGDRVLPIDAAAAIESQTLPGFPRGDPGDRFLIATARLRRATLATADAVILDYGAAGHVPVLDVRR